MQGSSSRLNVRHICHVHNCGQASQPYKISGHCKTMDLLAIPASRSSEWRPRESVVVIAVNYFVVGRRVKNFYRRLPSTACQPNHDRRAHGIVESRASP